MKVATVELYAPIEYTCNPATRLLLGYNLHSQLFEDSLSRGLSRTVSPKPFLARFTYTMPDEENPIEEELKKWKKETIKRVHGVKSKSKKMDF